MKKKYIQQIRNLVTPTEANKQMSGDQLREAIDQIFMDGIREKLFITLASTGHRSSEVTAKNYLKKAGA